MNYISSIPKGLVGCVESTGREFEKRQMSGLPSTGAQLDWTRAWALGHFSALTSSLDSLSLFSLHPRPSGFAIRWLGMLPFDYFRFLSPYPPLWTSQPPISLLDPPAGSFTPSFFSPSLYTTQDHSIAFWIINIHKCELTGRFRRLGGGWGLGDELARISGEYSNSHRFLTI